MRLNPNQVKILVKFIVEELKKDGLVESMNEAQVSNVVEKIILNDLKWEEEIEKEAEMLIKKYTANLHSEELDYEMLIRRAKIELAKRKGFKL